MYLVMVVLRRRAPVETAQKLTQHLLRQRHRAMVHMLYAPSRIIAGVVDAPDMARDNKIQQVEIAGSSVRNVGIASHTSYQSRREHN